MPHHQISVRVGAFSSQNSLFYSPQMEWWCPRAGAPPPTSAQSSHPPHPSKLPAVGAHKLWNKFLPLYSHQEFLPVCRTHIEISFFSLVIFSTRFWLYCRSLWKVFWYWSLAKSCMYGPLNHFTEANINFYIVDLVLVNTSLEQSIGYLATAPDEEAGVMMTNVDKKTINNKPVSIWLNLET